MATNLYLERDLPTVRFADQVITKLPVVLSGTSANLTVGGNLSVTGTTTFSGATTQKAKVISGQGATVTLTAAQSGSVCLFDRAAGIVYTLPAPAVGLYFDFYTTVTITSNAAEVDTDAGTTFLMGSVVLGTDNTASKSFLGNGTSHVKISSNGTTTGGILGGFYRVTCVSATQWSVNGNLAASGVLATPFA